MKVIELDRKNLFVPGKEILKLWKPEIIVKEYRLKKINKCMYVSGMKYDYELSRIVVNQEICADYCIRIPIDAISSIGIPCPVCLERFLSENKAYRISLEGQIFKAETSDIDVYRHCGDGDVPMLHWGMSGKYGTCYTCGHGIKPNY